MAIFLLAPDQTIARMWSVLSVRVPGCQKLQMTAWRL